MALEYVKVWTAFLDDPWVQSLNCNHRGLFLQLLILCRKSGDFSAIFRRSLSALGAEFGCDDSTCAKILRKFADDKKILFEKRPDGVYHIKVLNYQFWQDLKPEKASREIVAKKRQNGEKSPKIQRSKPSQEKPSQEIAADADPVVDFYNSICKPVGLPECLKLSDKRRGFLNARKSEYPTFDWPAYFARVSKSKFLCGGNDRGWRADFEWLVRPENFLKVNEGKYDNREGVMSQPKTQQERDDEAVLNSMRRSIAQSGKPHGRSGGFTKIGEVVND